MSKKRKKEPRKSDAKNEAQEEKSSKLDRLLWQLVPLALVFFACGRFAQAVPSPWAEILVVVQFLCPVAGIVLFFMAYPHPLRSLNQSLAAERKQIRRETKRKKKRR